MIENSLADYLRNRVNQLAAEHVRHQHEELENAYYSQYIRNYENAIASLESMFEQADPFTKIKILGDIKQQKKELANITRQYNQVLRQRKQRKHVS